MEEQGVVIAIPGPGKAAVRLIRSENCAGCGACGLCRRGTGAQEMIAEADDPIGAVVGQKVLIVVPAGAVLRTSLAIYILPLIVFLVFLGLAQFIGQGRLAPSRLQPVAVTAALAAMGISLLGLRKYFKKSAERILRPRLEKIIG